MSIPDWQKSSYSGNASNCVELAAAPGELVLIRESDEPAVRFAATSAALMRFLRFVRTDEKGE
ncbi:DUF397 domain-containing protein [Streptomyces sp. CB02923]|uniref:DUF397 domain-containing protein n=1 Tax=Streptomyces sp. CB02923 TaxID=1718985 RepID=UPI00093BB577|nr:DUF397 domain-containing protein [Streptomyces sp. CB02923]